MLFVMKAAFPGSFDPPTLGHMNIIQRSVEIFDEITVIIAENRLKKYFFSAEERLELISELVKPWKKVSAALCKGLIVDFLKEKSIPVIIRGIREGDFSYEFELSMLNKALYPHMETLFMSTEPRYIVLRSSSIKELASLQGDVSQMVPTVVAEALKKKYRNK